MALGERRRYLPSKKQTKYEVPVGDFAPTYLAVDFGDLALSFSRNYYSEDGTRPTTLRPPTRSFKIRKGKPFVLDFSTKPVVLFNRPDKAQTFKPGDQLRIGAIIVDPKHDLLLRSLQDTTKTIRERTYTGSDGEKVKVPTYASLDPTIVITNSAGKQVAEGKMPFG